MTKIKLPNITLVALAGTQIFNTVQALKYSSKGIDFGRILLISHVKPSYLPASFDYEYISPSKNMYEWCYKAVYELGAYIDTEYIILIHSDGFIVNPGSWRNEFLEYDYIGAPWPVPQDNSYRDISGNLIRVGNSVSLRSRRLLNLPKQLNIPWEAENGPYHEDGFLCCNHRHTLMSHGIKYAPLEVAKYFSHETMIPEIRGIKPFAFHKWHGSNWRYPGRISNYLLKNL